MNYDNINLYLNYMNTRLELLFKNYNISEKNRYEINQLFQLLPSYKKQNLLNNFEVLASRFSEIEEEINTERSILIWNEVENIKNLIIEGRINKEKEELRREIIDINN